MRGQSQEFHHSDFCVRQLACCNTSTISIFILVSFFFEAFFTASKEQKTRDTNIDTLVSPWRYSAASNIKRQVEVRYD